MHGITLPTSGAIGSPFALVEAKDKGGGGSQLDPGGLSRPTPWSGPVSKPVSAIDVQSNIHTHMPNVTPGVMVGRWEKMNLNNVSMTNDR